MRQEVVDVLERSAETCSACQAIQNIHLSDEVWAIHAINLACANQAANILALKEIAIEQTD